MRQLYEVVYTLFYGWDLGTDTKVVHVAADGGTSLDAVKASADAYMNGKYDEGVKKRERTPYQFKSIAPTHPLADVQHDTSVPEGA
jgi:hypothetical protein